MRKKISPTSKTTKSYGVIKKNKPNETVLKEKYKRLMTEVEKTFPKGISAHQRRLLKEEFLKNPNVQSSKIINMLGVLSSKGLGKK